MDNGNDNGKAISLGIIAPVILGILILVNLYTGIVWGPGPRGARFIPFPHDDPLLFFGFVAMKSSIMLGLFSSFWLPKLKNGQPFVASGQFAALLLAVIGLALVIAFIWDALSWVL